jgi:hypothetical protein
MVCAVYSVKGKISHFCIVRAFLEIIRESMESNTVNGPEVFLSTYISYHAWCLISGAVGTQTTHFPTADK